MDSGPSWASTGSFLYKYRASCRKVAFPVESLHLPVENMHLLVENLRLPVEDSSCNKIAHTLEKMSILGGGVGEVS